MFWKSLTNILYTYSCLEMFETIMHDHMCKKIPSRLPEIFLFEFCLRLFFQTGRDMFQKTDRENGRPDFFERFRLSFQTQQTRRITRTHQKTPRNAGQMFKSVSVQFRLSGLRYLEGPRRIEEAKDIPKHPEAVATNYIVSEHNDVARRRSS